MDFRQLIGHKTFEVLVQEALQRLKNAGSRISNLNIGGIFRTLTELAMQGLADLYNLLGDVVSQGFIDSATGAWLDLKVAEVGIARNLAVKTEGNITAGRADTSAVAVIPVGTIMATERSPQGEELRYFVTQEVIIPKLVAEAQVPVRAEFPGSRYNVSDGMISKLTTHIAGIDYVRNDSGWITTEGTDEETDEALRERYRLRWNELSQGGTRLAYISWARTVSGVADVAVDDQFPRGQGTVDVIITGSGGAPSQALIDQVQAYIDERKPITADALVKGPRQLEQDIAVTLLLPKTRGDATATQSAADNLIRALSAPNSAAENDWLHIGEGLYRSRIISLLMSLQDVLNVSVNQPVADVIPAADELITIRNVTVTIERASV